MCKATTAVASKNVVTGAPAGGEDDYIVLEHIGEPTEFDFEPKDHLELGESLGLIDMERGAKVSGARFYFLTGDGALLLDNVAVAPSAQGKGHGQALVAFAEAEAQRRRLREVRLYTNVLMAENLALYGRLGFRETGRVSEKGYERVYMAKAMAGQP